MIFAKASEYAITINEPGEGNICQVRLNSLSFGYATNTYWRFTVYYNPEKAHWNFEKPQLPPYYTTPREALIGMPKPNEVIPAPSMKTGYKSVDMQKYHDKHFPDNYFKVAWDYPCPHIDEHSFYVHPGEDRLLTPEELSLIYGAQIGEIPPKIKEYLQKHIMYYETGLWGDQDFSANYDKFTTHWRVTRHESTPFIKEYNFRQYTPQQCCPISDRYPRIKPVIFGLTP